MLCAMETTATNPARPVMNRDSRYRGRQTNLSKLDPDGRTRLAEAGTALRAAHEAFRAAEQRRWMDAITREEKLDAEEAFFNAITDFREATGTWAQVAKIMGVTHQSAQVWYKRRVQK